MDDHNFRSREESQERWPRRSFDREIQYLLRVEEQLLHSISARTPLPEMLHKICHALDSELGNMMSLISLPDDDATGLAAIAKGAALFGLYRFCSATVLGGNDEVLGSLEMYCSAPRHPFLREVQLIERATCLAAVAIKRQSETDRHASCKGASSGEISRP
jgi:hypothetical protein